MLVIGALTRNPSWKSRRSFARGYPLLHDTCRVIADPLVRNLATIGATSPTPIRQPTHPATMLALARRCGPGPAGERRIPIASFFTGPFGRRSAWARFSSRSASPRPRRAAAART